MARAAYSQTFTTAPDGIIPGLFRIAYRFCLQAALYEKLSAAAANDDEQQYNVDFLRKGVLSDEGLEALHSATRRSPSLDTEHSVLGQGGAAATPASVCTAVMCCLFWPLCVST